MSNFGGAPQRRSKHHTEKAATDPVDSQLLESTGYLLARIGMESRRLWTKMLAEHQLTPHQFGLIMALSHLSGASQQQLSRMLGIDPRNAMAVFDALEELNLIERREDPTDRRRHSIHLAPAGHRKAVELRRMGERAELEMLKGLNAHEKRALHELLIKLFDTMAI